MYVIDDSKFFLTFLVQYRRIFVYFLRRKLEMLEMFRLIKAEIECRTGKKSKGHENTG